MGADSASRRQFKKLLRPLFSDATYSVIQAAAKAWDIQRGEWSEPELDLIHYAVQSGDTALDIGANFGLYAYPLAKAVGPNGKVYAFEPIPFTARTFRLVAKILRFGDRVELIEKGCGEQADWIDFALPVTEVGTVSTGVVHMASRNNNRPGRQQHSKYDTPQTVRCEVIRLDDFLPQLRSLSFVKCDIEGADLFAMRGAKRLIEEHHPTVVIEINPWFLEGFGLQVEELVHYFTDMGYALYRYVRGALIPSRTEDIEEDNWVFVHPSRAERMRPLLSHRLSTR